MFYIHEAIDRSIWYIDNCNASLAQYHLTRQPPESFLAVVLIAFRAPRIRPPTVRSPVELLVGGWSESGQLFVGAIRPVCVLDGGTGFSPRPIGKAVVYREDNQRRSRVMKKAHQNWPLHCPVG